ncbi:MAG: hypothetical protein OXI30_10995 [Chloroflexota bacterium]|nr:hypothetical protein [Chloroflexota bacterium]
MVSRFSPTARIIMCSVVAAALTLSACRSSEPQQTVTAVYAEALSSIEMLRVTATVARARIQTTLDYAGTRVAQADAAGAFLASNLISLGTESAYIEQNLQQVEEFNTLSPPNPAANEPAHSVTAQAPRTQAPIAIVTPPAVTPPPTTTQQGPRLENISMASGVNEFDCAIDVNPRFTPASTAIYVVGRAFAIPAGATITSSWRRAGTEVVSFSFQREHEINDNCIWFFIDQSDAPFTVGFWSVDISVNEQPVTSPVAFQIVGN